MSSFLTKMLTKWLKNFRWMNTRVGKAFFEEKMAKRNSISTLTNRASTF